MFKKYPKKEAKLSNKGKCKSEKLSGPYAKANITDSPENRSRQICCNNYSKKQAPDAGKMGMSTGVYSL